MKEILLITHDKSYNLKYEDYQEMDNSYDGKYYCCLSIIYVNGEARFSTSIIPNNTSKLVTDLMRDGIFTRRI